MDAEVEGAAEVLAPDGWQVSVRRRPYRLVPSGHVRFPLTLDPAHGTEPGLYFVAVRTEYGGQLVEDVATVAVGDLPTLLPADGGAPEDWTAAQGTRAADGRDTGLSVSVTTPSVRLSPGRRARSASSSATAPVARSAASCRWSPPSAAGTHSPTPSAASPCRRRPAHRHLRRRRPGRRRARRLLGAGEGDVVRPLPVRADGGAGDRAVTAGPSLLGLLDGHPLPRAELDRRLAALRAARGPPRCPPPAARRTASSPAGSPRSCSPRRSAPPRPPPAASTARPPRRSASTSGPPSSWARSPPRRSRAARPSARSSPPSPPTSPYRSPASTGPCPCSPPCGNSPPPTATSRRTRRPSPSRSPPPCVPPRPATG
ncbi:hypothetical protein ACFQ1I_06565 [Kitasatospora arboriphila]